MNILNIVDRHSAISTEYYQIMPENIFKKNIKNDLTRLNGIRVL